MRSSVSQRGFYGLVEVSLDPGEKVRAEAGAMIAMAGIRMQSGRGGFFAGIGRRLVGESFFMNDFTGESRGGLICLAPAVPGSATEHVLPPGDSLYLQSGSFLGYHGDDVDTETDFQGLRGLLSGESAFFYRVRAGGSQATVWFAAFGGLYRYQVNDSEFSVDTGHLVGFTEGLRYSVSRVPGIGNFLLGGEAVILKLVGTGEVWVQTGNLDLFSGLLSRYGKSG